MGVAHPTRLMEGISMKGTLLEPLVMPHLDSYGFKQMASSYGSGRTLEGGPNFHTILTTNVPLQAISYLTFVASNARTLCVHEQSQTILKNFPRVFSLDGYARNVFKKKEPVHYQIEANHSVTYLYVIDVSLVPKAAARLATMNLSPLPFLQRSGSRVSLKKFQKRRVIAIP
ncbi:hypothetical protein VNO77_22288 [Canavalia gladiata]|uniref:Uncharacterized protein n=1 Tax=Canavalia gladiata TaxID=3824 RepID=A0AAN9QEB8_CANGL